MFKSWAQAPPVNGTRIMRVLGGGVNRILIMSPMEKALRKRIETIRIKHQANADAEIAQAEYDHLVACQAVTAERVTDEPKVVDLEPPITHRKAAKLLGCTTETIKNAITGPTKIPLTAKQVGPRKWLVSLRDLAAWVVQNPRLRKREKVKEWLLTRHSKTEPT